MQADKLIRFFHSTGLVGMEQATTIAGYFREYTLTKNEFFLQAGKIADDYMFLEEGLMRAFAYDLDGNDVTTNFYYDGSVVFEVSSFFNRTNSKENIQAITDCNGWCISYEQLNTLFHGMPEFREFGRRMLVRGFSTLKTRMLSMITETAEERYENLLVNHPEILQHAPLKNIATYLGITDSSLSRIRKDFQRR